MNAQIIYASVCLALIPAVVRAGDERPILKESPAKLVGGIESMAEENVAMASINVAHDVVHKRLRIFSIEPNKKDREFKDGGYDLEIIHCPETTSYKTGVTSYRFQNNNEILAFAASQFKSGNKAFAKRLVGLLAEEEPDLFWSLPTHPVMTIQQIRAGLEKDDDSVKDFLIDESEDWSETLRMYGP